MDSSEKNRRTLRDALRAAELGDEALAFVKGEAASSPSAPSGSDVSSARFSDAPRPPARFREDDQPPPKATPRFSVIIPAIVSMSFRLPASLSLRLARVSADRKLRRERPFSQQDIVAEALEQWFDRQHESD